MRNKKLLLVPFFILLIFIIGKFFDRSYIENIINYINGLGAVGYIAFSIFYILVTIIGIPSSILTIFAGTLFGLWKGLIVVVISATIAAIIAFYISRIFNLNFKRKEIRRFVKKIDIYAEKKGFYIIMILRLAFMPYIILSYAAGLVKGLKARDFIFATFLTNIFGSFVFIFLGSSLLENWYVFLIAIFLVIVFMQIPKYIKKKNEGKI